MNLKNLLYVPLIVYLGACGCNKGYPEEVSKELGTLRSRFEEDCRSKTDRTLYNGSLDRIKDERNRLLNQLGCKPGCEEWKCGRDNYYGWNLGEYRPNFAKRGSCECTKGNTASEAYFAAGGTL